MADAKKCDRCGKLYERYVWEDDDLMPIAGGHGGVSSIRFYHKGVSGKAFDLCRDCMGDLIFWLRNSQMDGLRKQTAKGLRRIKVETASLACLGCECEDGCSINGCAIIGDAIRLLSMSNLDTSPQSTKKLHQGEIP